MASFPPTSNPTPTFAPKDMIWQWELTEHWNVSRQASVMFISPLLFHIFLIALHYVRNLHVSI